MITPNQRIQVFISSVCGDEPEKQKYNLVREALKTLIESTGFAKAYVFESEGASTTSAGQHYTFALEDSDVCIFLIDNSDGITQGVLKEIDTAKKHNIKSFYYFCDQNSKEKTPLQKSLQGAQYAKSETIHDFKDLIKNGASDLINDLVTVYRNYCKGRLTSREDSQAEQAADISSIELSTYSDIIAQKDVLANIDYCVEYFTNLILDYSHDEVKKTGALDRLCASFLPVLFEGVALNKDSLDSILLEIEKYQSLQHFAITKKRYEAIKEYYSGNQEACISRLQEALQIAKQNDLPEWLIKDILIDLRNQDAFWEESCNRIILDSIYQKELDDNQSLLYYPSLDRFTSNFYEGIIEQAIKYKTQSPGTITFGHDLGSHIKSLAGIYVLVMYYGSLAHLQLLYKQTKYIAFYCTSRYSNWSMKKLLLKTAIVYGKQKETDGIIRCFGELLSKMNEKDAYEIYSFANSRPIAHQRFISKLEAFRITSYYLDDEDFNLIWSELYELILQWIEDENSVTVIGGNIFSAIEGSYLRISQDHLIEIICKCILNNKRKFYEDIFKLIRRCVILDQASPEYASSLLEVIMNIVRKPDERNNIYNLGAALYTIRKKNRALTEELDKVIAEEMPSFYSDSYRLETSVENDEDMPKFLGKFVAQVFSDNENQGKGGVFSQGNQPHITVKNIIQHSKMEFSKDLIDSAFKASCATLLKETQTIEAKMDAIELLIYLLKSQPNIQERNKDEIGELLSSRSQSEAAHSIMTNLNETNLRFSALLLYSCLGEDIIVGLLETLADLGDDTLSNRKACLAFLNYLESNNSPLSDIQLEYIILQQTIEWCTESDSDIRWNAVLILFSLLRNEKNINIVCNQLVKLMDTGNAYIKNLILRNIFLIKDLDFETYKYIIKKGTVDTNYVVRKVANEVSIEN